MKIYQTKVNKISGTSFDEIKKNARIIFRGLEKRTRRKAYIRSVFFNKDKIFLEYFWPHINQKSIIERKQRLRYLSCAIDLIENSHFAPSKKENPNNKKEILYRFHGETLKGDIFFVQIKEDTKSKNKYLMSVFPFK